MTEPWSGGETVVEEGLEGETVVEEGLDAEGDVNADVDVALDVVAEGETEVDVIAVAPDDDDNEGAADRQIERPQPTGDPRVDAAISRLDDLDGATVAEQAEIVDEVQRRLASALAELDPESSPGS